jgi:hypothetical protein
MINNRYANEALALIKTMIEAGIYSARTDPAASVVKDLDTLTNGIAKLDQK